MRKRVLILGAGTAGTTLANTLVRHLDAAEWRVTVVDRDDDHVYQPGLLFVPFTGRERDLVRSRRAQLRPGVELVEGSADRVVAEDHQVFLGRAHARVRRAGDRHRDRAATGPDTRDDGH